MTNDREMLRDLLDSDKLTDEEREAFGDMLDNLGGSSLSEKQRRWVRSRYEALELDAGEVLNLASSGEIPKGREVMLLCNSMPKPLKPPGRR